MTTTDFNRRDIEECRANHGRLGGQFAGVPVLSLHTIGARSGEPRVNPMLYLPDGDRYIVLMSAAPEAAQALPRKPFDLDELARVVEQLG